MGLRLLLGPVGSGKTDEALARLRQVKAANPLAAVWVLMTTERQIMAFRNRLFGPGRGYIHLHFFNFELLYQHINQAAGAPRRVLHSDTRAVLLRQVLRERWGQPGALFRPLPGFVDAIARQIDELKGWQIGPEAFAAGAGDDPKLAELARLYTIYEARLHQLGLIDREGQGALALQQVREMPQVAAAVDWLLVDGFDQFNPLHAALIAELGHRAGGALVTLAQPDDEGAASAASRFALARERLLTASRRAQGLPEAGPDDGALVVERLPARAGAEPGRRAVRHLVMQVWSPVPAPLPAETPDTDSLLVPGVNFLEAPDPAAEVAAVLRRVKALLLGAAGVGPACRPDDILIAVRDWTRYGAALAGMSFRYSLPLALHEGAPLIENPAVAALLRLLALPDDGYRRQSVVDGLNSPYLRVPGWPGDGIHVLEAAARASFVVGGQDEWRTALASLVTGQPAAQEDDDDEPKPPPITPDMAAQTLAALDGLFAALEALPNATTAEYVDWLDGLIGLDDAEHRPLEESDPADDDAAQRCTLNLVAAVREDIDEARRDRDLKALAALKRALRGLRTSAHLLTGLGILPGDERPRAEFMADLRQALLAVTLDDPHGRDGRVLATTVADARGLPHRHVFLLGLSEGVFPAPVKEDPLLLESERDRLRGRGVPVPLRAERADDSGLFYELAGLAGDTLTLSRPTLRDGVEWVESALWRTAWAAFEAPRRIALKVGAAVPANEAATDEEAVLAVAEASRGGLSTAERALAGWLAAANPVSWERLRGAYGIESGRLSRGAPHDAYSGRLTSPELIAALQARFAPGEYAWSASQLNKLGECAFQFFSQRVLKLESLEPPQEGLDVRQRGTLVHDILEQTYRRVQAEGLSLIPAHRDRALALLDEEAATAFARAPAKLGFRPRPGWRQEQARIREQIAALVTADFTGAIQGDPFAPAPVAAEGERTIMALEGEYDAPDLLQFDGVPVRVRGRFDRIDRHGDRWIVVDYKSGSTAIPHSETLRGRNFQMMIYLLALRAQQPAGAVGGFFWHLPKQETSGTLWLDTAGGDAIVQAGKDRIAARLAQVQAGDFAVEANGVENERCSRHCDYQHLCRMAIISRRKPRGGAS